MNQNRAIARNVARVNMEKAGYTKRDHRGKDSWSRFFSRNWRKFAKGGKR